MEFVQLETLQQIDEKRAKAGEKPKRKKRISRPQRRKENDDNDGGKEDNDTSVWRRRPAVIRRPKKQRSKSLSQEKLHRVTDTSALSPTRKRRAANLSRQLLFRSVERLPTLSPFDEERIVWMRNLEDDAADEEERRNRHLIRQAAHEIVAEDIRNKKSKEEKHARKQWDTSNVAEDYKLEEADTPAEKPEPEEKKQKQTQTSKRASPLPVPPPDPPLSSEVFVVSRGWQLDQGRLLRSLEKIKCASFARVQATPTINRVVENVRPHLDAVVVHLGTQDLVDAAHSIPEGVGAEQAAAAAVGVAGSVATVVSKQIIKVANQNR